MQRGLVSQVEAARLAEDLVQTTPPTAKAEMLADLLGFAGAQDAEERARRGHAR